MASLPMLGGQQGNDDGLEEMWQASVGEIEGIDAATENWKSQKLPLAKIKKIMKSEDEILQELEKQRLEQLAQNGVEKKATAPSPTTSTGTEKSTKFMISGEAPVLMSKACELMIKDLAYRAWRHTERNRRRTLQKQDVNAAVGESEVYDFLIDIVPRVITPTMSSAAAVVAATSQQPQMSHLQFPAASTNTAIGMPLVGGGLDLTSGGSITVDGSCGCISSQQPAPKTAADFGSLIDNTGMMQQLIGTAQMHQQIQHQQQQEHHQDVTKVPQQAIGMQQPQQEQNAQIIQQHMYQKQLQQTSDTTGTTRIKQEVTDSSTIVSQQPTDSSTPSVGYSWPGDKKTE